MTLCISLPAQSQVTCEYRGGSTVPTSSHSEDSHLGHAFSFPYKGTAVMEEMQCRRYEQPHFNLVLNNLPRALQANLLPSSTKHELKRPGNQRLISDWEACYFHTGNQLIPFLLSPEKPQTHVTINRACFSNTGNHILETNKKIKVLHITISFVSVFQIVYQH